MGRRWCRWTRWRRRRPWVRPKIGTDADDDGYLPAFTFGASNVPTVADRGDFDGALNPDTAECPRLAKGTVLLMTYTVAHNSMINPDLALTFLEG